jgi:hypothetical protein
MIKVKDEHEERKIERKVQYSPAQVSIEASLCDIRPAFPPSELELSFFVLPRPRNPGQLQRKNGVTYRSTISPFSFSILAVVWLR